MQTMAVAGKPPSEVVTHGGCGGASHGHSLSALCHAELVRNRRCLWTSILVGLMTRATATITVASSAKAAAAGCPIRANASALDPRDVFTRDLELPRGPERERVWARDSDVRLRGSEVRTLATVGAFRVVPAGDLRDGQDRPLDPHRGDLRHLRDQGLVETIPAIGEDRALVVLTERAETSSSATAGRRASRGAAMGGRGPGVRRPARRRR